ncbi:MAG: UDP-N-acetylmuramoyl-L-alanyl-D-glutamate--2,6-diaminopimelate ligase [Phycisphaerales bacterium]
MNLGELIQGLGVRCVRGEASGVRICDVTEDSRTAVPGSLFVARRGLREDGRRFVREALECGAVAILTDDEGIELPGRAAVPVVVADELAVACARLAERFYGNPSEHLRIVAVTGTNGKTTVAHLTHQLLNHAGVRCGLIGTVDIDDGREVAPAAMTTPPAIELSRTLATMVENGVRACAMEASSHALDQGRTAGITVDVGVFTNLTGDHLDYHKTMDAYARAKRRLFESLPADGVSVINADDAASESMGGVNPVRCSMGAGADWRAEVVSSTLDGLGLRVTGAAYAVEGRTRLLGAHNAMNALEALASADAVLAKEGWSVGARRDALGAGLSTLSAPRGRLEPVDHDPRGPRVLVDFAHTDDALRHALMSARELVPGGGRLWVVFGCGGLKDTSKRPRMGAVAAALADEVVVTSDNPRTEPPAAIVREILAGMDAGARGRAHVHVDRERAIGAAIAAAGEHDLIVLAGKGHEREQELPSPDGGIIRREFDDAKVARGALREARLRRRAASA